MTSLRAREGRPGGEPEARLRGIEAIRRPRLYEEVAKQLQEMIGEGGLRPGDHLPPERELMRQFAVSRGSVRDGIRILEVMGLVRSRQGGGTVVQELSADALIPPISAALAPKRNLIAELLDIRRIIEPAFAARAAAHATADEIAGLQEVLRRQREKALRSESTVDEDAEFHYLVAMASGNTVVNRVVDVLMDLMRESRARSYQVDGRAERSLEGHAQVLRAIQRHAPHSAERAMCRHLEEIEALLLGKGEAAAAGGRSG